MEFNCVKDCSQCCIEREYYPSKKFGKIGVLILPEEKMRIESLAKKHQVIVEIIPRIGISNDISGPEKIIAYQMMGKEENGNTCPFLDTESELRSPHNGFVCKIYEERPLACRAYPLIETEPITLDSKCAFCQTCTTADSNLNSEIETLVQIKSKMSVDQSIVWRYATGIGNHDDSYLIQKGWIKEQ
ncbi:MAG: YkgJ family cysteine cluster protein [Candidatus Nitrosotenuis sp.]